jgi:hypothetical protein
LAESELKLTVDLGRWSTSSLMLLPSIFDDELLVRHMWLDGLCLSTKLQHDSCSPRKSVGRPSQLLEDEAVAYLETELRTTAFAFPNVSSSSISSSTASLKRRNSQL